jgi:hypothetical protein
VDKLHTLAEPFWLRDRDGVDRGTHDKQQDNDDDAQAPSSERGGGEACLDNARVVQDHQPDAELVQEVMSDNKSLAAMTRLVAQHQRMVELKAFAVGRSGVTGGTRVECAVTLPCDTTLAEATDKIVCAMESKLCATSTHDDSGANGDVVASPSSSPSPSLGALPMLSSFWGVINTPLGSDWSGSPAVNASRELQTSGMLRLRRR